LPHLRRTASGEMCCLHSFLCVIPTGAQRSGGICCLRGSAIILCVAMTSPVPDVRTPT
jgi:hypothetical protein